MPIESDLDFADRLYCLERHQKKRAPRKPPWDTSPWSRWWPASREVFISDEIRERIRAHAPKRSDQNRASNIKDRKVTTAYTGLEIDWIGLLCEVAWSLYLGQDIEPCFELTKGKRKDGDILIKSPSGGSMWVEVKAAMQRKADLVCRVIAGKTVRAPLFCLAVPDHYWKKLGIENINVIRLAGWEYARNFLPLSQKDRYGNLVVPAGKLRSPSEMKGRVIAYENGARYIAGYHGGGAHGEEVQKEEAQDEHPILQV